MGKNKSKHKKQHKPHKQVAIFGRNVGCKGTSIIFIPTKGGARCEISDATGKDIDFLSKEDLRYLLGDT